MLRIAIIMLSIVTSIPLGVAAHVERRDACTKITLINRQLVLAENAESKALEAHDPGEIHAQMNIIAARRRELLALIETAQPRESAYACIMAAFRSTGLPVGILQDFVAAWDVRELVEAISNGAVRPSQYLIGIARAEAYNRRVTDPEYARVLNAVARKYPTPKLRGK